MQFASYILIVLISMQALMPCAERSDCHGTEQKEEKASSEFQMPACPHHTTVTTSEQDEEHSHHDECPPGCNCVCCAVVVILEPQHGLIPAVSNPIHTLVVREPEQHDSDFTNLIWQPPRRNA